MWNPLMHVATMALLAQATVNHIGKLFTSAGHFFNMSQGRVRHLQERNPKPVLLLAFQAANSSRGQHASCQGRACATGTLKRYG